MKYILSYFVIITILLTGCTKERQVIKITTEPIGTQPIGMPDLSKNKVFVFDGAFQKMYLDASTVCDGKKGVAFIVTQQKDIQNFVAQLTLDLISPRNTEIYCVSSQFSNTQNAQQEILSQQAKHYK
jgi:hypothetical protein